MVLGLRRREILVCGGKGVEGVVRLRAGRGGNGLWESNGYGGE